MTRENAPVRPVDDATGGDSGLVFSVAGTLLEIEQAWQMLYGAYLRVGFIRPNREQLHTVPQAIGPHTAVIIGNIQGLPVSTTSVIGDSPLGLPLDVVYHQELRQWRAEGRRLIEVGLFGDRRKDIDRSFYAILELMRYTYWFGRCLGSTDFLCGIPPERVKLYRRFFGFEPVGEQKSYKTVEDNPVQLMRLPTQYIIEHHADHRGLDYFVKHPLTPEAFDHRFRFTPAELRNSSLQRFLDTKRMPLADAG